MNNKLNIFNLVRKELQNKGIKGKITLETEIRSLSIDSLDMMELIIELEKFLNLKLPDKEIIKIKTINDLVELIVKHHNK